MPENWKKVSSRKLLTDIWTEFKPIKAMKGLQGMMKNLIDEVADSKQEAARLKYQLDKGKISVIFEDTYDIFRKA